MKINDILHNKGRDIITISPDATIRELVALLAEHNIGAVVVSQDGQTLAGIVSERDIVRHLNVGDELSTKPVREIMTSDVFCCGPDHSIHDMRNQMTERRVRHVPVIEQQRLIGIVSIGDVVKSSISDLEFERDQLNSYLTQ